MTRSKRTWRSAENGPNGADSGSSCPQLYRMYRKLPKKPKQQKRRKQLREREQEWSGREDLNLRPPGPEILGIGQVHFLLTNIEGAPIVYALLTRAGRSQSWGNWSTHWSPLELGQGEPDNTPGMSASNRLCLLDWS